MYKNDFAYKSSFAGRYDLLFGTMRISVKNYVGWYLQIICLRNSQKIEIDLELGDPEAKTIEDLNK